MDTTLTYDLAGLTQIQANLIEPALLRLCFLNGITYDSIKCIDGVCIVKNASVPVTFTLADVLARQQAETAEAAAIAADSTEPTL